MTAKTTLRLTDRHQGFLARKVAEGAFATPDAAVAAAVEQMMQDEAERDAALGALAAEVRSRMATPREAFVDAGEAFAAARARLKADRSA